MIDSRLAPYGAFLLRATSGLYLLVHASQKLFVFTPAGTAQFFASIGLPAPLAYLAILIEVAGGLALLFGIFAREAAVVVTLHLLTAAFLVHLASGFFFNNPNGGWEYPVFWALSMIVVALIGEGAFAVRPSKRG